MYTAIDIDYYMALEKKARDFDNICLTVFPTDSMGERVLGGPTYECPNCHVPLYTSYTYCPTCGVAVDWSKK